jgi:RNA recognition motif-containing protein
MIHRSATILRGRSRTEPSDMNKTVTKLIVRNLSRSMTMERLDRLFSDFGTVRSVSLATDVMTGRCGGFGHVHLYETDEGAALGALNGRDFDGRVLCVSVEQKRFPAPKQL